MKTAKLTMALAACAVLLAAVGTGTAAAEWGITSFKATYEDSSGAAVTQAGAHANSTTELSFNQVDGEEIRDAITRLPAGFYGNPQAVPTCNGEQLVLGDGYCNPAAQVGVFFYEIVPGIEVAFPIFNMVTPSSQTDVLGAIVAGAQVKINISVRTDGDYGLTATLPNINQALLVGHSKLTLWGVPADPANDGLRCLSGNESIDAAFGTPCTGSAKIPLKPFLSMPARCEAVVTEIEADSWQQAGRWYTAPPVVSAPLTGCENLDFSPTLKARPTTNAADSPSGLDVDLAIPQDVENPKGLSSANLKTAEVTLPEGLVINPSGANGLAGCSPSEIGLTTAVGSGKAAFTKAPPACPDASKIGEAEVDLPVFPDPLKGSVYAALPGQNPFGNLLSIYLSFEGHGIVSKLAGKVTPDPQTGRLTATFDENPQVAFEDFKLRFFGGSYGVLRTPSTCGSYATTSTMIPWSAPATPPQSPKDEYAISQGAAGKGCVSSEAQLPNAPSFQAGSVSPIAGTYKPFVVNLRRDDGSQEFSAVTLTPPPGLVAKLKGTEPCSDQALEQAAGKSGKAEQARSSCPSASKVGSLFAAAGAGPAPYNTPGAVYLAGPYKGAPISFAFVVPAVAGPYDLGTIVTRAAVFVDPGTAEVKTVADRLPRILQGIPLDVRSVSVRLDKPDFTLNPTSCDPMAVKGSLLSTLGNTATLNNRFQVAECGRLGFKPKLKLSLKGGTKRGEYPALTAVLNNRSGDANIASVQVALPHSEFLAQNHIRTVCTRVQWAADACPKGSIYGKVKVETPILGYALTGNVYLRSSSNPLPDLVPDLRGPAFQPIRFEAAGKTDSINGGIRNTFSLVPDVPFTKLTLQLQGGKKSLLQNSRNICAAVNKADVNYTAHNGATYVEQPPLSVKCKQGKKKAKGKAKKGTHSAR
jgi:hypothetical protein